MSRPLEIPVHLPPRSLLLVSPRRPRGGCARTVKALSFLLLLGACAPRVPALPAAPPAREELLRVDRAFSARASEKGVDVAFAEYAAEDATMLPMNGAPLIGKQAIMESFADSPKDVHVTLRWEPKAADVSADLGYTWGTFVSVVEKGGEKTEKTGKYVSVWKRQAQGAWKWVIDIGNLGPK